MKKERRTFQISAKGLQLIKGSAPNSLDEGFEETLTFPLLRLIHELGISFKMTNCIESLMAFIRQKTNKVDYWKKNDWNHRWLRAAVLDIEPRLRKAEGHWYHLQLKTAILEKREGSKKQGR